MIPLPSYADLSKMLEQIPIWKAVAGLPKTCRGVSRLLKKSAKKGAGVWFSPMIFLGRDDDSEGIDAGRGLDERGVVLVCRRRGQDPGEASVAGDAATDQCGARRARRNVFDALRGARAAFPLPSKDEERSILRLFLQPIVAYPHSLKPYAGSSWPSTILRDELNACGFEGRADIPQKMIARCTLVSLKISNR